MHNRMVGHSATLADFSLLPYNIFYAPRLLPDGITIEEQFPAVAAWENRLKSFKSVIETIKEREIDIRKYSHTIPIFRGERERMNPVLPVVEAA